MSPQVSPPSRQGESPRKAAVHRRRARLRAILLATSALASASLATAAHAGDAAWRDNAANGDFNNAANWGGNAVPDGTAIFGASTQQNISFSSSGTTLGGISLLLGAGNYTFNTDRFVEFTGAGLVADTGASITFNVNDASLSFRNSSSSGNAKIVISGSFSAAHFSDNSTAGQSEIINNQSLDFSKNSKAGQSHITNNAMLAFSDSSHAESTTIDNHGSLFFDVSSNADSANITSSGRIFITGQASGGTASIAMTGADSVLDISRLATTSTTVGSLAGGGNVFLGGKNLAVGGNNKDLTTFSGVIQDGGLLGGGTGGSLTKEGTGSLNLTGVNTYTGATRVKSGVLSISSDGSMASSSGVTVDGSAQLVFSGTGKVGSLAIANHGTLLFENASHADSAFITSDGEIFFSQTASGGKAGIALEQGGRLDISSLTASDTTVGSIESKDGNGTIVLGRKTLKVGGNDLSTSFAGIIQDNNGTGDKGGSLTKEGKGALTLTGQNTYTGATTVTGGTLVVDGSIATSSGVTVGAGGTLSGTGTVSSTSIQDGGTLLAGHSDAPFGALTVQGSLAFTSGATYLVQVSPASSGSTNVTGTATLGGATVRANFAPGSYVTRQYDILHAGDPLGDKFGKLVNTNLSPFFAASLSYGAKDVFLDLNAVDPASIPGLNVNQRNVARGIVNSFNTTGGIPAVFATLTQPGLLTQVSGETAVGSQQATFDAMNQFMNVLLDPTVGARSGAQPKDALAAMPRKAVPLAMEAFEARWGVWAAGYGGSQSINGDAVLGSNKTTSSVFGSAVGADYRFSPNTVAGFALAGGGTHFNVANGGSGNSDLFQAGAYLRHTQGAAFLAAALAYGWQDITTNRTITVAGIDSLRGRFNANAVSGRLEGGYKVATAAMDVTPYAAGQFVTYRLPSFAEQAAFGTGTFALNYSGKDVTATRTELGVKTETSFAQTDSSVVTLRGRLAWAHDFNTDRNVQAAFLTLPGSAFVVNGAQPAADTALASLSAETIWRSGWAASATFDSQLSDTTRSYAGKGVVRYTW